MPKKIFTNMPAHYPVCVHENCPLADDCLHRVAYDLQKKEAVHLRLINPERCSQDDACTHFKKALPVTYAVGFTNFKERMYPSQYQRFMDAMVAIFGRTPYFERRRGVTPISPKEQAVILKTLKSVGGDR
jgi:hypothetical protein